MFNDIFTNFSITTFLFLAIALFIGSFIDAIAGGGGLITVPAYISSGLPIHIALGCNKMSGTFSTVGSSLKYITSGKVNFKALKYPVISSLIGASLGVYVLNLINAKFLAPIVIVLLLSVTVYTFTNKTMGLSSNFQGINKENTFNGTLWAFFISFYIGFFGPGGGSFLIFAFIKIYKFDFIQASGNAKLINLIANIASLLVFIFLGKIAYLYSVPLSLVSFIGAQFGAKFSIKRGVKFIRPIFLIIASITTIKMIIELFF